MTASADTALGAAMVALVTGDAAANGAARCDVAHQAFRAVGVGRAMGTGCARGRRDAGRGGNERSPGNQTEGPFQNRTTGFT